MSKSAHPCKCCRCSTSVHLSSVGFTNLACLMIYISRLDHWMICLLINSTIQLILSMRNWRQSLIVLILTAKCILFMNFGRFCLYWGLRVIDRSIWDRWALVWIALLLKFPVYLLVVLESLLPRRLLFEFDSGWLWYGIDHITPLLIIYQLVDIASLSNFVRIQSIMLLLLKIHLLRIFQCMWLSIGLQRKTSRVWWSLRVIHQPSTSICLHSTKIRKFMFFSGMVHRYVASVNALSLALLTFTFSCFLWFNWGQC
jgi:hypothetical protein